ncbi:hypothetical protein HK097_010766 [Rhizophlyctis rosea]|uniref:Band 7 domain-containing protein n=1 Tax=Rhizophlyctis rosea TaxID=64517 RepID=A0AAD5S9I2_9FUNG|nr:hypothetical protein HK097_010766 [Rhizophlyctis rosea]
MSARRAATRSIQKRTLITIVEQGFQGMRLSLGKDPVKLEPGIHLQIPVYHTVRKIDMRERSLPIKDLIAFTSDNVPVTIEGSLFYQVRSAHDALFNVSNYAENIYRIGASAMRSTVGRFDYDSIIADRNAINVELKSNIGNATKEWGIDCTRFEIQNFSPSNRDIQRQLEQQMEAERNRRKQVLDTEAAVNVAEGMKRKTILESEGMLQAQKNQADGNFVQAVKMAEARRRGMELEAEGLALQIRNLAESLGGDEKLAVQTLLEMKKIEQMRAIAEGTNNTIYFGKDGVIGEGVGID